MYDQYFVETVKVSKLTILGIVYKIYNLHLLSRPSKFDSIRIYNIDVLAYVITKYIDDNDEYYLPRADNESYISVYLTSTNGILYSKLQFEFKNTIAML